MMHIKAVLFLIIVIISVLSLSSLGARAQEEAAEEQPVAMKGEVAAEGEKKSSTEWTPETEAQSAVGVFARLLGKEAASRFRFLITRKTQKTATYEKDQYSIQAVDGIVYVNGTTGVALCSGAYQYLKQALGVQVTWGEDGSGDQLQTALRYITAGDNWPDFELAKTALVPLRYGWNMCTFSYTAVWWNETRWQREVDWMAMHGINMPLAVTGVEYVWKKVFVDKYKVPLSDLQEWFSGPAFLTWQRMGNLRAFGGPLSLQWINRQKDLNVFILQQMRSLGMKPVLSCFAGHVPAAAKTLFPDAKFARSESWAGFSDKYTGVWHMTPTSKEYQTLGEDFMRAQQEAYGDSDFYNCDTFNEVDPASDNPAELSAAAAAVTSTIKAVDPKGIWVMQGWLFYFSAFWKNAINVENYLKGAKDEDMIVLDLVSEQVVVAERHQNRRYEYYGKKWIYNMLHNFGGVHGIYGNMHKMFTEIPKKISVDWVNCIGVGITAEAVEHNAMLYEIFTDLFFNGHFRQKPKFDFNHLDNGNYGAFAYLPKDVDAVPIEQWVHEYGLQRVGAYAPPTKGLLALSAPSTPEGLQELQILANDFYKLFEQVFYRDTDTHLFMSTFMDRPPRYPPSKLEMPSKAVKSFKGSLHAVRLGLRIARLTDLNAPKYRPIHTDLVDLMGSIAHAWFDVTYTCFAQIYAAKEALKREPVLDDKGAAMTVSYEAMSAMNHSILGLFDTLDGVLASNPNYLLGRWIASARAMAHDIGPTNEALKAADPDAIDLSDETLKKEANLYDFNARNQVTVWGEASNKVLDGYARKLWSGLYKDFYRTRHSSVLDMLSQVNPFLGANRAFDNLRQDSYDWVQDPSVKFEYSAFPTDSQNGEDTVELSRSMLRNLVILPQTEIDENFETLGPLNEVDQEANKGIVSITVPDEAAIVGFMASLCHRSIGPMCLGFDPTRKLVFVKMAMSADDLEADSPAAAVKALKLQFKSAQEQNKEVPKGKIYIRRN